MNVRDYLPYAVILLILLLALVVLAGCTTSAGGLKSPGNSGGRGAGNKSAEARAQEVLAAQGSVLWQADMETGDLSQWRIGAARGAQVEWDSGRCYRPPNGVSTEQAHSGRYAMQMTIDSRQDAGCRSFRRPEVASGRALYYSAWYYFPVRVQVGVFWNIFQFKASAERVWSLRVGNLPDGTMTLFLSWKADIVGPTASDGVATKQYFQTLTTLPVGRWVHLEVYLKQSEQFDGQITVWQDGVELFNVANIRTRPPGTIQSWSIDSYGRSLQPNPTTLFVDDVAVSTSRLGP